MLDWFLCRLIGHWFFKDSIEVSDSLGTHFPYRWRSIGRCGRCCRVIVWFDKDKKPRKYT